MRLIDLCSRLHDFYVVRFDEKNEKKENSGKKKEMVKRKKRKKGSNLMNFFIFKYFVSFSLLKLHKTLYNLVFPFKLFF